MDIAAGGRVVVAVMVLEQAGSGVLPLAGVAEFKRDAAREQHRVAPRVAGHAGGERAAGIGQQQGLAQVAAGDPGIDGSADILVRRHCFAEVQAPMRTRLALRE